ncbi:thioredoxin family protein [Marinobacterium zhoushanense]|uniref:Thioredoxin family protein n=1 Tax=Marinobacterium zhoushanense TaxID=1679163 RepID=A0ABQ1KAS3_9GAMM|nr:thioredoxin family protein [Marinobacterium zhoushanense]
MCEHAIAVLQSVLQPGDAEVDLVDIAFDDRLLERYATSIPVLRAPASGKELGWPFNESDLRRYLKDVGAG